MTKFVSGRYLTAEECDKIRSLLKEAYTDECVSYYTAKSRPVDNDRFVAAYNDFISERLHQMDRIEEASKAVGGIDTKRIISEVRKLVKV